MIGPSEVDILRNWYSYIEINRGGSQGLNFRSFLTFLRTPVVNGQNSDIWEFGKGALSANYIFSATTTRQSERLQTQFWVEDGVNDGMVEKICLSSEERLSRISRVTSEALDWRNKRVHHWKAYFHFKSIVYKNSRWKTQETPVKFLSLRDNHLLRGKPKPWESSWTQETVSFPVIHEEHEEGYPQ